MEEKVSLFTKFKNWLHDNQTIIISVIFSLAMIALGILCCVSASTTAQVLMYIIGGVFAFAGITFFIVFFVKGKDEGGFQLVYSIPLIIGAIYMFLPANKDELNNFMLIILGFMILIISLFAICKSIAYGALSPTKKVEVEEENKNEEQKKKEVQIKPDLFWLWLLFSSFIVAGCGIAIAFIDQQTNPWVIYFAGGTMIFEGVRRMVLSLIFQKSIVKCEKGLKEKKIKLAKEKEEKEKEKEQKELERKEKHNKKNKKNKQSTETPNDSTENKETTEVTDTRVEEKETTTTVENVDNSVENTEQNKPVENIETKVETDINVENKVEQTENNTTEPVKPEEQKQETDVSKVENINK